MLITYLTEKREGEGGRGGQSQRKMDYYTDWPAAGELRPLQNRGRNEHRMGNAHWASVGATMPTLHGGAKKEAICRSSACFTLSKSGPQG